MSAIYVADCDCSLISENGAVADLRVVRHGSERRACLAWLAGSERYRRSLCVEMPVLARYFAVHGPGGHVIGVRP